MEYQAFHAVPWQHGSFWVFVAILIFAVLFASRIASPLTGMLDRRAISVREALGEAARLKAEAEAMLADATVKQRQAMRDAQEILATAHSEATRLTEELKRDAEAAARWRERLAMDRITAAEQDAVNEVRGAAIEIAAKAATQTLRETFGADADAALIDRAIAGVPRALKEKI